MKRDELDDFPHFPEEELNRMRAEILADGPDDEIPCDENGDPIGYTWEETREMMYRILSGKGADTMKRDELADNPEGKNRVLAIPRDENGKPVGYTVDEVFANVDKILSEGYGVDFAKVHRMIKSGELNDADLSDELLSRPEFAYKPYPGFKPKPLPENFKPDPCLLDALETPLDDDELDDFPHFTEEELDIMRAEILADNPEGKNRVLEIPCDENGDPIGTPWEEVLADIYDDLSKHFGVDLRTL